MKQNKELKIMGNIWSNTKAHNKHTYIQYKKNKTATHKINTQHKTKYT